MKRCLTMNTNILANLCGWCAYIHKGQAAFVVISTGHAQGLTRTAELRSRRCVQLAGRVRRCPTDVQQPQEPPQEPLKEPPNSGSPNGPNSYVYRVRTAG